MAQRIPIEFAGAALDFPDILVFSGAEPQERAS
jgi:hypothetical protein